MLRLDDLVHLLSNITLYSGNYLKPLPVQLFAWQYACVYAVLNVFPFPSFSRPFLSQNVYLEANCVASRINHSYGWVFLATHVFDALNMLRLSSWIVSISETLGQYAFALGSVVAFGFYATIFPIPMVMVAEEDDTLLPRKAKDLLKFRSVEIEGCKKNELGSEQQDV
ncbi:hypothetical protein BV898_18766 [Hypsibius exemplaris]|uniref:Uncharacterized protein n=1 Tax=Hypsibius exemplaris TaxID=2072580 RepID=A0A9X6NK87_HYPEX|nr:hypothetical protein BV898_18766 [Hypsibius exemplaris]